MHVWHEMSPTEAAGAEGEGGEAANKPKLSLTTAAATPTAFRFSVVPHPLVSGEPIESLQRQRKQYNVRLFILRHLKALIGTYCGRECTGHLYASVLTCHDTTRHDTTQSNTRRSGTRWRCRS